jgi:hypothetical protein
MFDVLKPRGGRGSLGRVGATTASKGISGEGLVAEPPPTSRGLPCDEFPRSLPYPEQFTASARTGIGGRDRDRKRGTNTLKVTC